MAYSNVGIANLALRRIGVGRIASFEEDSVQAIDINAAWEYIRDEVLQAKDWRFAKRRATLAQSTITPEYEWDYAYATPDGFLRLCRDDPTDHPVFPADYPWKIETLSDGNIYLLSDYDSVTGSDDFIITFIKRITDPSKYSALFISTLSWRLAAELSTGRTESPVKFKDCMNMYKISLDQAEGHNMSLDSLEDETGSDSWDSAGR